MNWFRKLATRFRNWRIIRRRNKEYEEFVKNDWPRRDLPETYGYATKAKPRENIPQDEKLIQQVKDILEAQKKCPTCGGELKHG